MIRAILFDLDETLLDRSASIQVFISKQVQRFEKHLTHVPQEVYCQRFLELDGFGYVPKEKVYAELVAEFSLNVSVDALFADFQENGWRACILFAGAVRLLQQLRATGYKLGIITNGSTHSQRSKIEQSGLAPLVDVALISEAEKIRKPEPEIFLRAVAQLGVQPADCIFVGDNPEADICGAHSVGMKTIWCKRHLAWPEGLTIAPSCTISTVDELLGIDLTIL